MNGNMELQTQVKFCAHVQTLSRGCFLYCKLLLDLIEKGHLVLKSSNYKILPVNLSETFLLLFNLKFPTIRSFEKLCVILNVCLASLYPLTFKVRMPSVSLPTHPQGMCAWHLSTHSPSRYVWLASLYPLTLKICVPGVSLPTHPQSMCAWCLSIHSPSKLYLSAAQPYWRNVVSVPIAVDETLKETEAQNTPASCLWNESGTKELLFLRCQNSFSHSFPSV